MYDAVELTLTDLLRQQVIGLLEQERRLERFADALETG